ncbi:MAG: hypothetical protein D3908_02650 [Candidatus Electrothrix sp. AUS4]|nr:hypothetical protein [Candidatus Electrothrix sp. AUS4]
MVLYVQWRAEEAEAMLLQRQLTRAAADWEGSAGKKERKGLLWDNNPRLVRTQEILREKGSGEATGAKRGGLFRGLKQFWRVLFPSYKDLDQSVWLNQVETAFVRRSVERKRNWTRGVTVFISAVIVLLITGWWYTSVQKNIAVNERIKAEKNLRRVEAIQLATESENISSNIEKFFYSWVAAGGDNIKLTPPSFTEPLRLARNAILKTMDKDNYVTREAFDALRKAVEEAPPWNGVINIGLNDEENIPIAMEYSPDGNFLTLVNPYGKIAVLDMFNNKKVKISETRNKDDKWSDRRSVVWCGSNYFLVSGGVDNNIKLFNINSINNPHIIGNGLDIIVTCNSSGTRLAMAKEGDIYMSFTDKILWEKIFTINDEAKYISFSSNDNYLSIANNKKLYILNQYDRKKIYSTNVKGGDILGLKWIYKNKERLLFILNNRENNEILIKSAKIEEDTLSVKGISYIINKTINEHNVSPLYSMFLDNASIKFSQDGRWIATAHGHCAQTWAGASCNDVVVRIWNTETGALERTMYGHKRNVTTLSWHPNSHMLASGENEPSNRVFIWKVDPLWDAGAWRGNDLTVPDNYRGFRTAAFWEKNGNSIKVVLTSRKCQTCSMQETNLPVVKWDFNSLKWNNQGWNWPEEGIATNHQLDNIVNLKDLIADPVSPDNKKELFWLNRGEFFPVYSEETWGGRNKDISKKNEEPNVVRITNSETGKTIHLIGHESWVSTAEWSPDGQRVLTSSSDGTVRIWDAEDGKELARYEQKVYDFSRATWSPDGKWILVGYPNVIIWPADVNELLKKAESLIKALDGENALEDEQ